jgi:aspartate kinase
MEKIRSCRRIVVKFGGSSLADHERLLKAATSVVNEARQGAQVAVVVSAMGKTTDMLLSTAKNTSNGKLSKHELDDILSMGERTSVRIFAATLRTNGVESRYFDPHDSDWPIITDASFSNANPLLDECRKRVNEYVLPLVEKGVVPVIAGFVGKTLEGKVTTLGRGGSDTTAFILAEALCADEVILVTDADGIMTGDPKIVSNPVRLREVDVTTLVGLADSGAKFIHRKALKYKPAQINVRVINHAAGDLQQEGTVITGALPTELGVEMAHSAPVAAVTIVGQNISSDPSVIKELLEKANAHSQIVGMSMNQNSIILYSSEAANAEQLLRGLHSTVVQAPTTIAMAVKRNLAFLKVKGVGLEETHGIVGRISEILRLNEVNIAGMLTITSSILLFVEWEEREKALNLIGEALRNSQQHITIQNRIHQEVKE